MLERFLCEVISMNIVLAALRKKIAGIEIPTTRKELEEKGYVFINGEPTDENLTIIEKNDYCNRGMQEKGNLNIFIHNNPEATSKVYELAQDFLNRKGEKFDFVSELKYDKTDRNNQYTLHYKIKPIDDDANAYREDTLYIYPDAPYVHVRDSKGNEFEADIMDKLQLPSGDKGGKIIRDSHVHNPKKNVVINKIKLAMRQINKIINKIRKSKGKDFQQAIKILEPVQKKLDSLLQEDGITTGSAEYIQYKLTTNYLPLIDEISHMSGDNMITNVFEHESEFESFINFDVKTGN